MYYVPWLSNETNQIMKNRNDAKSLAAVINKQEDWLKYKQVRNLVPGRLRSEEANWQRSKQQNSSNNPAEQWRNVLGWLGWENSGSPSHLFFMANFSTNHWILLIVKINILLIK